jgi:hypothetical protein
MRLVGARGFEPPTTGTPYRCATGLRYAPIARVYHPGFCILWKNESSGSAPHAGCRLSQTMGKLLDLDLGASLFELGLGSGGIFFGNAFLDRLGSGFDQILRLLETKTGQFADGLDDLNLVRAGLG